MTIQLFCKINHVNESVTVKVQSPVTEETCLLMLKRINIYPGVTFIKRDLIIWIEVGKASCNDFWHQKGEVEPNHTLRAQSSTRLFLLQILTTIKESPGYPHFWPAGYRFESFHYSLKFNNLLLWFAELWKVLYLWLQFYYSKRT